MPKILPRRKLVLVVALLSLVFAALFALPRMVEGQNSLDRDPVTRAWRNARAAGAYHFASDITQMTLPVAKVSNVGRTGHTDRLRLEGETDLRAKTMQMRLWPSGGSVLTDAGGVAFKVEDGKTYTRRNGGVWQAAESLTDGIAPEGDFLAYLQAIRDVQAHEPEQRAGIQFTRYSFNIDGPTFAAYMREQMVAALRAKGELPPGADLNVPSYYNDMTGTGELWVGENGLPLRQTLQLTFPEQRDQIITAQINVDFSRFGTPQQSVLADVREGNWAGALQALFAVLPNLIPLMLLLGLLIGMLILFRQHNRKVHVGIVVSIIISMLLGPVLNALQMSRFFTAQTARAAEQQTQQPRPENKPAFNPHAAPQSAPVAAPNSSAASIVQIAAPVAGPAAAPAAAPDPGTDTDGDGLTDFAENAIGTDPGMTDTDEDGIDDAVEVKGVTFGGQIWHGNPQNKDSNNDGIGDGQEWDTDNNNQLDDADGDGVPDAFDNDNDNDGVPDRIDLAPLAASTAATPFTENNPLKLTLNNLTANLPTLVDFQIRPTDPNHLWYAFNVVDWPRNDNEGQIQDVDGGTFAYFVTSQGRTPAANESFGDMKLVPMLELRINGPVTNLPAQDALTAYNISVNNLTADGSQKAIYIPLSIVNDDTTGQRVAFTARMNYLPTGSWPTPHEVRLAWVVQALVDLSCDHTNAQDVAAGCAPDDYIHNTPQVVQSYYDDFQLTGLNVSEQHGAATALIYEDPAIDPNLKDDVSLTMLTHGLDESFLAGRDADNNGVRDVDLNEIARRFDHTTNGSVSATERWGLDTPALNILRVERHQYPMFDQATMFTAMTDTLGVLNGQFNSKWNTDNTLKPTIAYVYEQKSRSLGLDASKTTGNYVLLSPGGVTVSMQTGPSAVSVNTMVGLKWTHYCRANSSVAWSDCPVDDYWLELESRYGNVLLNDEPGDPATVAGSNYVMQLYNIAVNQGFNVVVESENQLVSGLFRSKTDSETESDVRTGLTFGAAAIKKITNLVVMNRFLGDPAIVKARFGLQVGEFLENSGTRTTIGAARLNPRIFSAIAVSVGVAMVGIAIDSYFLKSMAKSKSEVLAARIVLRTFAAAVQTYSALIDPILTVVRWSNSAQKLGLSSTSTLLKGSSETIGVSRAANAVGAVISILVVWGFFGYSMATNHVSTSSVEFSKALAETIAATVYIIILAILSATVVGLILVGIVTAIDAILTTVCELGGDDRLKHVAGQEGSCFTLGATAVKAIAYLLYNYDLMINTSRDDMVVPGSPSTTLSRPNVGFVAGNDFTITLPITTHVVHKNPEGSNGFYINFYLWFFSQSNIRSTTFNYALSRPDPQDISASLDQMRGAWQVAEDHKYVLTPMYGGVASSRASISGINLPAGINQPANFYLNMGYALPAYECWIIPAIYIPVLPVCRVKSYTGNNSNEINTLRYDILPNTIGGFMALANKPTGGQGFAWDATFDALHDADGDGQVSSAYGGLDPNDAKTDSDNDGLSDSYELDARANGNPYSASQCDTDNDGLTDGQEAVFGSNPSIADTDNDGLLDRAEVWHQIYNPSTCQPTNGWTGGWPVSIPANVPFFVNVNSDPTQADGDSDGISDLAEKQLAQSSDPAQRIDKDGNPYLPNVFNASPITVLPEVNDRDGFVALGQDLIYTTTVIASSAMAPSVLDVTAPGEVGGSKLPAPLPFDPSSFNKSQTVVNQTNFTVFAGANRQQLTFTSNVRARLAPSGPSNFGWDPVVTQSLGSLAQPVRFMDAAPFLRDRQDSYLLGTMASSSANAGGTGQVLSTLLPAGTSNVWAPNATGLATSTMADSAPDVACNNAGRCLMVWDGVTTGSNTRQIFSVFFRPDGTQYGQLIIVNAGLGATAFQPVVASDGTDFAVAVHTADDIIVTGITGGASASSTPLWQAQFAVAPSPGTLNSTNLTKDMVWIGDRYRIAYKEGRLNRPNHDIYVKDLTSTGGQINTSLGDLIVPGGTEFNAANANATSAPVLAYNPTRNETWMLYQSTTGEVHRIIFSGSSLGFWTNGNLGNLPGTNTPITGDKFSMTHDPRTGNMFVTVNGRAMIFPPFATTEPAYPVQDVAVNSKVSLACPIPDALPAADLRFDSEPGSGNFDGATCAGNTCPALGAPGATDNLGNAIGTPASDYSVQFDGSNDVLSLGNPLGSEFSVAFWYRATGGASSNPFFVESNQPSGFGIFIYNNNPIVTEFFVGDFNTGRVAVPQGLADGNWHYVVATRASSGALALYLDGNPTPVASRTSSPAPTMGGAINIGGGSTAVGIDNLQIYKVALSGATVQSLYQRTNQSYCVGASNYSWAKLNISRPDTRGGKITNSGSLSLTVDTDKPSSSVGGLTNGQFIRGNTIQTIGGNASDPTSGVRGVEVDVNNGGFQPANGQDSWAYNLAVTEGNYTIRTRATDAVGNLETPSAGITIKADASAPNVTLNALAVPSVPTRNAFNDWSIALTGTAIDPIQAGVASNLPANAVEVMLQGQGAAKGNGWQAATRNGDNWSINYRFAVGLADPTGSYTVSVRAVDNVGNYTADNAASSVLHLDVAGPAAVFSEQDSNRQVISDTVLLSGVLTDTGIAGVDKLEVAFVTVEQIAALPNNISTAQADAQLNRTWLPATVAQRGANASGWTLAVPAGLEGEYQIDLRGTDTKGNVLRSDRAWRGIIDTLAPRVLIVGSRSNYSWYNPLTNLRMYELTFTCSTVDRYLAQSSFNCPSGNTPIRSFIADPALQTLFPDRTIVNGISNGNAMWWTDPNLAITVSACDLYGHCSSQSSPLPLAPALAPALASALAPAAKLAVTNAAQAVEAAPQALVVAPTQAGVVSAINALNVTVAAEADAVLKQVTIKLDNAVVQTLDFAQAEGVTRTVRTVALNGVGEGPHTLSASATDWANGTQASNFTVAFSVDAHAPTITIDPSTLTSADTWQVGSGVLRFNGTVSDSIGIASVQIREGNNPWSEAEFDGVAGTWQTALPVQDPEGRTLNITVRAIDRAGNISEVTQAIGTNLSSANPPDTEINATPSNPSSVNTASFVFTGSATVVNGPEVVGFECQLDDGTFAACTSPQAYADLSKGEHHFKVRSVDAQGNVDLTPASFDWTVSASALDVTLTSSPSNSTSDRNASFAFNGTGSGFECSLDGVAFAACNSPQSYSNLAYGDHRFQVRATANGAAGTAISFAWTIFNAPPVASSQTVTIAEGTSISLTLATSDADPLSYKVSAPAHGVLVGFPPNVLYSPNPGFAGQDAFTFVANDGNQDSNTASVRINVEVLDRTAPTTTIGLSPTVANGLSGWYKTAVRVSVSATDGADPKASGVAETRCVLDPIAPVVSFADLAVGCAYLNGGADVASDGLHTVYAASRDARGNVETSVVSTSFKLDRTPPQVSVLGVLSGSTYSVGNVPVATCGTTDATSGVAASATISVTGGNAQGVGQFTATCSGASDKAGNSALAQSAVYTVGYSLSKFVVLAQEGVAVSQLSIITGSVGARVASAGPFLADNAEVSIGAGTIMISNTSNLVGDSLALKSLAQVYNPSYNTLANSGAIVRGTSVTPINLKLIPSLPSLPTIAAGTQNISVAAGKVLTLAPGSYGTLTVGQGGRVNFTGGLYQFQAWSVAQNSRIFFNAASEVRVAGRVSVGQLSIVGPAPTATALRSRDIVLYVAGQNGSTGTLAATPKAVVFSQGSLLRLNIVAPNGTVQMDQATAMSGAVFGKWVSTGPFSLFSLDSRF